MKLAVQILTEYFCSNLIQIIEIGWLWQFVICLFLLYDITDIAINKYVCPRNMQMEKYAGHIACCHLVSHAEYAPTDKMDEQTPDARRGQ